MGFSYVNARRKYAFFDRVFLYFLGEISKFGIETLHTMRDNHLFTEKR